MKRLLAALALFVVPALPAAAQDIVRPLELETPFWTTPPAIVMEMLRMAGAGPDDIVYDLGSGDGRIPIIAVRDFGVRRAVGIEIDDRLVAESIENARRAGVADRVSLELGNIFERDFSEATVVTMYLLPDVVMKLRPRLLDMRPGTRIVSHEFHMDDWKADHFAMVDAKPVHVWVVPAKLEGAWQFEVREGQFRLDITQKYQDVTGTLTVRGHTVAIEHARLVGDHLRFEARVPRGTQTVPLRFDGKLTEQIIRGAVMLGSQHSAVSALRLP